MSDTSTISAGGYTFTLAEFCSKKAAFAIKRGHDSGDDEKAADAMVEHLVLNIEKDGDGGAIAKSKHKEIFDEINIMDFQKIMEKCSEIFSGDVPDVDKKKSLKA